MRTIVVVMGAVPSRAGLSGLSGEASGLQQLLHESDDPNVIVLSLGLDWSVEGLSGQVELGKRPEPLADRVFRALGFYALRNKLSTFPIGRLINSMGPVDQGRVFWRRVRQNADAISALKNADVAVAADLAAVKTCWTSLRRRWVSEAFYDYRAAGLGIAFTIPARRM